MGRLTLLKWLWLVALIPAIANARPVEPPRIRAVRQKPGHCGVASAETILRAYGVREAWARQTALAAALCARLPDFKNRHPAAADAIETYYPDFKETYQTELAELLIDHGYCVISTRTSKNLGKGRPDRPYWDLLQSHLTAKHLAIFHVPGHYLVATGVDIDRGVFYFVDPWRPEKVFSAEIDTVASGKPFHTNRSGKQRPGWDGRVLIVWRGERINQKDRCPVCRKVSAGKTFRWCPTCRCFIDRRSTYRVQLALDTIVKCAARYELIKVGRSELRSRFRKLKEQEKYGEEDLREALLNYPLASDTSNRFATLARCAGSDKLDLDVLSLDDLIDIVSHGQAWRTLLDKRLAKRKGGPGPADQGR